MPIKLEDIVGENYFAIFPKEKYDIALSIAARANHLQSEISASKEAEAQLIGLQRELSECIGITEAEKLDSFARIEEAAWEEYSRLEKVKEFHTHFFQQAIEVAKSRVQDRCPKFDLEEELRRDSIFHTLARSGILIISRYLGMDVKEEDVTEAILRGDGIERYLPKGFSEDDIKLFVLGMQNSVKRNEFLDSLKVRYGLNEEQIGQIKKDLQRRFKNVGHSQPVRIGKGAMDLWRGKIDPNYILRSTYLTKSHYPLAFLITQLPIEGYDVPRFHTSIANYVNYLATALLTGSNGIHQEMLKFLSELTGINGFEHVTVWGAKYDLIHPIREIPDDVWGHVYGMMLARLSNRDKFTLHNINAEGLQAQIERLGRLDKKLKIYSRKTSSDELNRIFDEEGRHGKTYETNKTDMPRQVVNLINSVKLQEVSPEFANHALNSYAMLRGYKHGGYKHGEGYDLYILHAEDTVRALGSRAGVNISEGFLTGRILTVYMSNLKI